MTSIFVAKLDFGVTEEELRSMFEAYGGVKKAHIATDRETGKPRGFAFVEMYNDDEAQEAIRGLDGRSINGRNIAVKEAEDRRSGGGQQKREFIPKKDFTPKPKSDSSEGKSSERDFVPPVRLPNEDSEESDLQKTERRRKKNDLPKTKEVDNTVDGGSKKKKLNPYKKSGKDQIFLDDEEDLEDFDLFGRDEDIEVDDDALSKYLVNSDDDDDDEFDDEEYDEDYDDEDEYDDEDNW